MARTKTENTPKYPQAGLTGQVDAPLAEAIKIYAIQHPHIVDGKVVALKLSEIVGAAVEAYFPTLGLDPATIRAEYDARNVAFE